MQINEIRKVGEEDSETKTHLLLDATFFGPRNLQSGNKITG